MITVIQFLAPKSHCAYDFIHNRKRNRLVTLPIRPFKPQTAAEAAVVGLPGSKRRVGTLGSVRF